MKFMAAILLICSFPSLYALGKKEVEEEKEPLNPEWVLCITGFDVTKLSPSQRVIGDVLTRNLVVSLNKLSRHIRVSGEYTYYYDYARISSVSSAGKSLEARRSERDLLLFRGDSNWQYRNKVKTLDETVKGLEESYEKAETEPLDITLEPVFRLTEGNLTGSFPVPPPAGGEYAFCRGQNADAYLEGHLSEFHGRIYLYLKLYTLYTRSFVHEIELLFATDATNQAVEEISGRLVAAVSGTPPAGVSVKTNNEDSVILIKDSFVGRGETGILEYAPEAVDVTVFAEAHEPQTATVDLQSGELAELRFNLRPLPQTSYDLDTAEGISSPVYQGALYVGETPLTLQAPLDRFEYIHTESPRATGSVVFRAGQTGNPIYIGTKPAPDEDAKPLGKARRQYYNAWGRFWISLPLAFLANGLVAGYRNAYQLYGDPVFEKNYQIANGISIGLWVVCGVIAAESIFRIIRYNHTASESVPAGVK
jgi:hypothetical protein